MNEIKDGGQAFPVGFHPDGNSADSYGMTLRDWFAGMALNGICANSDISINSANANLTRQSIRESFAEGAYKTADAMIAEREKRYGKGAL